MLRLLLQYGLDSVLHLLRLVGPNLPPLVPGLRHVCVDLDEVLLSGLELLHIYTGVHMLLE